jgi:predicted cupin superfamily sugar epimerase
VTTTVMIATRGNKVVVVAGSAVEAGGHEKIIVPPGAWFDITISGDQTLSVKETEGFVSQPYTIEWIKKETT